MDESLERHFGSIRRSGKGHPIAGEVNSDTVAPAPLDLSRTIIVVSGLPRSGTSMLMQMLAAGGMPLLSDDKRAPDEDNPLGYFELNRTKELPKS